MIHNDNNRAQMVRMRFLREFNIKVLDEWLAGCVSFCLQENPKSSNESLFQFAYSQWLLADLTEVGVAVLPSVLREKVEQHSLSGSFPVQMQYLIDISEPAYEQWRNLYDRKLDEAEDEVQMRRNQAPNVKKRRMLKLELTDGKQTVLAVEHSPIKCLNTKLAPGLKLLLTGPMRCVNKVILLESRNVRVLGGEVDVLLITNAYENVILRTLNKPANPNPKLDYEEGEVAEGRSNRAHVQNIPSIPMDLHSTPVTERRNQRPHVEEEDVDDSLLMGIDLDVVEGTQQPEQVPAISTLMDDDDMDDLVQLVEQPKEPEIMYQQVSSTRHSQSSPVSVKPNPNPRKEPSFDELIDYDIDALNSLEDQIHNELREIHPDHLSDDFESPKTKKSRLVQSTPIIIPALRMQSVKQLPSHNPTPAYRGETSSKTAKPLHEPQPSTSKTFNNFSTSALFEDSMDCMEGFDDNNQTTAKSNILSPSYPYRVEGTSLVTIEQILALQETDRSGASFVVYCEVNAVTEQPRIRKDCWHLSIELMNLSDVQLPVRLHDGVIAKMVQHDAATLMRMHKTDRNGVMKLLDKILIEFKDLLQKIKCFWRVVYQPDAGPTDLPIVMETYEMNEERGVILLDKVIKENCSQLRKML